MTQFQHGGRRPGAGRKAGTPNKLSNDIKTMVLAALDAAGGAEYLLRQAEENPGAFMVLVGKVLPTQITGANGGPIQIQDVTEDNRITIDAMLTEFDSANDDAETLIPDVNDDAEVVGETFIVPYRKVMGE